MKLTVLLITFLSSTFCFAWYMTHPDTKRQLKCPPKYIPIISEYENHFSIPLGGETGSAYIFDMISTDFVMPGRLNGGSKKYYMHCAEFVKKDCHSCETTKLSHENYCVHYIHPQNGKQKGCLARGVIPTY